MIVSRRNFISGLLAAGAGFTILPGAGRIWRAERRIVSCSEANYISRAYLAERYKGMQKAFVRSFCFNEPIPVKLRGDGFVWEHELV